MPAITKVEYLDVVHRNTAARWRDIPCGSAENATVRSGECSLLDRDIADDVNALDFDACIWKGIKPTAEECDAGCFCLAAHSPGRPESNIVGKHFRKSVKVMGVEGC